MKTATDAQTFRSEVVDEVTGIRVLVEIVVPEECFAAEIDWSKPGAHLDRVSARNELVKRVDLLYGVEQQRGRRETSVKAVRPDADTTSRCQYRTYRRSLL